jgi:heme exporter protein C
MNLKQHWYKWVAAIFLLYVVLGGLFLPLKPGITGLSPVKLTSGLSQTLKINVYNAPWLKQNAFDDQDHIGKGKYQIPTKVLLVSKSAVGRWETSKIKFSGDHGQLLANLDLTMGTSQISNEYYSVFVQLSNGKYLGLPDAIYLERAASDTAGKSAFVAEDSEHINNDREIFEMSFPNRMVLNESVRNLFYHVPMWFAMLALLGMACWYAVRYLRFGELQDDMFADSLVRVGIVAGILGCITGATWARVTWQSWWPAADPKLNGVAIGMTMYMAYLLLRSTLTDPYQRARITSVYSVFIFPIFIALIVIMPKLSPNSLHPGSGGTVGFNKYDLDSTMRLFFYPAVIGWIALYYWIANLRYRIATLKEKQLNS